MKYCIKRTKQGKTYVNICTHTRSEHQLIDENKISAEDLLKILIDSKAEPAHLKCIYEDLTFEK